MQKLRISILASLCTLPLLGICAIAKCGVYPTQKGFIFLVRPVVQWNFMAGSGTLPSLPTETRSSNGTYFNSSGIFSTAGNNTIRYDFPGGVGNGILLEPAATNLALQSNALTTTWTNTNLGSMVQNATGVDGTTSAWTMTDNSTNGPHEISQSLGSSVTGRSIRVVAKAGTASYLSISPTGLSGNRITFNLSNGTIDSIGANNGYSAATSYITNLGNGFYLCVAANNSIAGLYAVIAMSTTGGNSGISGYVGSGSTMIIQYVQAELNSYSTSYYPTTTSTATRSADVPAVPAQTNSGPSILETMSESGLTLSRTAYAAGAFSWPTGVWARSLAVYPNGTPMGYLNTRLAPGTPY